MTKPAEFTDFPDTLKAPHGPYRAVVQRVIDGDTVYVLADVGLNDYVFRVIRLRGINAPELFTGTKRTRERGRSAQEYLQQLLPEGTAVLIYTHKDRQTFGRYVATVVRADGADIGQLMVEAGHAVDVGEAGNDG